MTRAPRITFARPVKIGPTKSCTDVYRNGVRVAQLINFDSRRCETADSTMLWRNLTEAREWCMANLTEARG
jgi:hypothetical protein